MFEFLSNRRIRILDPLDRISEVLFALIMVLTFTCSFSLAGAGREEVRELVIGAVGCNLAWGIIDAVFYLLGSYSMPGQGTVKLRAVTQAANPADAHQIIADSLPPVIASVLSSAELEQLREKLRRLSDLPVRSYLRRDDWVGAAVFLLTTLPVLFPFALIAQKTKAYDTSLDIERGILVGLSHRGMDHADGGSIRCV